MQYLEIDELTTASLFGPRPELTLVGKATGPDPAVAVAQARVRHALRRALQEFLDRAGFTELDEVPDPGLAAGLERTCWLSADGDLEGLLAGADGPALLDLLERGLLAALHGTLNRSYADFQTLGVDLDRLKYVHLPVRRVRRDAPVARPVAAYRDDTGSSTADESRLLAEMGEPILLVHYTPDDADPAAPAPSLLGARLLLPGGGRVAVAGRGGRFSFNLPALLRFLCATEVAVRARPYLA